jgi:hypothetical protein
VVAQQTKLRLEGSQNLSIGIAGQPLGLAIGPRTGTPGYVTVVTNTGHLPEWQVKTLASDGVIAKLHIGTVDGQFWWIIPSRTQLPDAVGLAPGENFASTIILNIGNNTLEASSQPAYLAPIGGPSGFYFATNNEASAQLNFFATS